VRLALIGFGNVGRALAHLLHARRAEFPFRITGMHTARHGTATSEKGLPPEPAFGPSAASVEAFLDKARADVAVEITTLNPSTGEPAIAHIRAAFARGMHVVTANKGPIAHAFADLQQEALARGLGFRFESTVMDGAPVFNLVRKNLPGVRVLGFTGVLNSTSKVIVEAMERGETFAEGLQTARRLGIAEADGSYDIDGWDSAAKTAALANVLMDARTTPQAVSTRGIGRRTPERVQELGRAGKTVRLVSRARLNATGVSLRVRAEVLDKTDILASVSGTSNLLLLHTDQMGTLGTVSIAPGVRQTAYGVFIDLVDLLDNRLGLHESPDSKPVPPARP
jgi:homoserine dehydrogenase